MRLLKLIVFCLILGIICLIMGISGCSATSIGSNTPYEHSSTGSLILSISSVFPEVKRSINPSSVLMKISSYEIIMSGPNNQVIQKTFSSATSLTNNFVETGIWRILVNAKNDLGQVIAAGGTQVSVDAGKCVDASVIVYPCLGTGTLKIRVSWPTLAITNISVYGVLMGSQATYSNIQFSIDDANKSAYYEDTNIKAGYYFLSLQLMNGDAFARGIVEAVRILSSYISETNYVLNWTNSTGNMCLNIQADLQNPVSIELSGQISNLLLGSNMTIRAIPSDDVDIYEWYLNGQNLYESNDSITIGSTLPTGNYRLDVIVQKGSSYSSDGFEFEVVKRDQYIMDEEFTNSQLDSAWQVVSKSGYGRISLSDNPGFLRYYLEGGRGYSGGWFQDYNYTGWSPTTTVIGSFISKNYLFEAKLHYKLHNRVGEGSTGAQHARFYLNFGSSDSNYLVFNRGTDYWYRWSRLNFYMMNPNGIISNYDSQDNYAASDDVDKSEWMDYTYWYRIERSNTFVCAYLSSDGSNFSEIYSYQLPDGISDTNRLIFDQCIWTSANSYYEWDYVRVKGL